MAAPPVKGWENLILARLNAPVTPQNLLFLDDWQRAEGGNAENNPFNTTQGGNGTIGNYNSVGVKRYGTAQGGINATVQTLTNGRYGNILSALKSGKSAKAAAQALANSPWGTGGLVLKMLGGAGGAPPAAPPGAQGPVGTAPAAQLPPQSDPGQNSANLLRSLVASNANFIAGKPMDQTNVLQALAQFRQPQAAAPQPQAAAPQPMPGGPAPTPATGAPPSNTISFLGNTQGVKAGLLSKVSDAAKAAGVTKIRITSGYRSPGHNAAVGGVTHSNHMTGDALDGEAFIPNRGWVPLGVALQPVVGKFGLRSGNVPGFYNGGPDPVHVDDGANQR